MPYSAIDLITSQYGAGVTNKKAEVDKEWRESKTGRYFYKGQAALYGGMAGYQFGRTMDPVVEAIELRMEGRDEYNESPYLQEKYPKFRDYWRAEVKKPTRESYRASKKGAPVYDTSEGYLDSVQGSVEQMEGWTKTEEEGGIKDAIRANNNPGNIQWFKGIENRYRGASKGGEYTDVEGKTRYHTKFSTVEQGRAASRDIIARHWEEAGGDSTAFAQSYTGQAPDTDVVKNYAGQINRDLGKRKTTGYMSPGGQGKEILPFKTRRSMRDKNKIKAYYLNSVKNYVATQDGEIEQTTKPMQIKDLKFRQPGLAQSFGRQPGGLPPVLQPDPMDVQNAMNYHTDDYNYGYGGQNPWGIPYKFSDKLANAGRVIGDRLQPGYVPPWYSDSYDPTAGNIDLSKSTSFNPIGGILGKLLKWQGNR